MDDTGESDMNPHNCIDCAHLCAVAATCWGGERTPAELSCVRGHWVLEDRELDWAHLIKALHTAKTCPDFLQQVLL